MPRTPKIKKLENTRLASGHGGWVYCDRCGENIGYLCYVTYDEFQFSYQCKCGASGKIHLAFEDSSTAPDSKDALITIKNRLCCPQDHAPLFTILSKKLTSYMYEVVCAACKRRYTAEKAE